MRLSASARLAEVAQMLAHSSYPLLAEACASEVVRLKAGATLADCLAPMPLCMRAGDDVSCAISASTTCAARDPGAAHHAIIGNGPCRRANQSAVAAALVALEAQLEVANGDETRVLQAEEFFMLADPNVEHSPLAGWRLVSARLPAVAADGFQRLSNVNVSNGPESAICLASIRRTDGDVRFVLGGVATRPYRIYTSVEEEAMAGGLDEETIAGLADRALLDAEVDAESARKSDAAAALLRRAIGEIALITS